MNDFGDTFLKFFFLLTPFFVLSVFLGLTADWDAGRRRMLALRTTAAVLAVCLLLFFFGNRLFSVLGITLDAFRVGAGALLFLTAARMVQGASPPQREEAEGGALAVVPLAIPITVGPGTTGALLVLGAETHGFTAVTVRCGALALAVVAVGLLLVAAGAIRRAIGVAGMAIFSRLSGLFLAALAAELILVGARNVLIVGH
jgi:multiple antibiotic resistance protein